MCDGLVLVLARLQVTRVTSPAPCPAPQSPHHHPCPVLPVKQWAARASTQHMPPLPAPLPSPRRFSFGRPDLDLLRAFCAGKFGWQRDKADELLLPVVKAFDERQSQLTMDQFLTFRQRFAKIKSKRLQKVGGVGGRAGGWVGGKWGG